MIKKTSKYLVLMTALLVFSFLLASCQSMIATTEEMKSEGFAYLQASGSLIELRSDVPAEADMMVMKSEGFAYLQASGSLIELRSDVPAEADVMVDTMSLCR